MGEPSGDPFWFTWTSGRLRGRKWEVTHTPDETQKLHLFKKGCGTWAVTFPPVSQCFQMVLFLSLHPHVHTHRRMQGDMGSLSHFWSSLQSESGVPSAMYVCKMLYKD